MKRTGLLLIAYTLSLGFLSCNGPSYLTVGSRFEVPLGDRPTRPGDGFIWIEGDWFWNGSTYQWRNGFWSQPRPGIYWRPGQWQRNGGGWYWKSGRWRR